MNIHLINDIKFLEIAYKQFEKYYPQENIFFVDSIQNTNIKGNNIYYIEFKNTLKTINQIKLISNNNISNIFIHYLSRSKANIALELHSIYKCKLYWIFYGAELYSVLSLRKGYELNDYETKKTLKNTMKCFLIFTYNIYRKLFLKKNHYFDRFISKCDFFCFWNVYDFELLKTNFKSDIKFRYYYYGTSLDLKQENFVNNTNKILINHSASLYGNHKTLINKLKYIDPKGLYEIIAPLSYGDKSLIRDIVKYGNSVLSSKFQPILNFMSLEEYNSLLLNIPVAIFGHNRQEGAGNIFLLLRNGSKVFLRERNNMFKLLKEWGFIIFSFENELNGTNDLRPLRLDEKIHNKKIYTSIFSYDKEEEFMRNLFT